MREGRAWDKGKGRERLWEEVAQTRAKIEWEGIELNETFVELNRRFKGVYGEIAAK